MSTAAPVKATTEPVKATVLAEKSVSFRPFGKKEEIELKLGVIRSHIAVPTRQGNMPTDGDLIKFMMLCKQSQLDPWVGDAYLLGYDSNDGPQFNLIVAVQALLKRAELNPDFNGIESGILVRSVGGGDLEYREGSYWDEEYDVVVGGWARVYRKNVEKPFFVALKRSVYDTQRSRWRKDPSGMIEKCCIASVIRKAFPNVCGNAYTSEEMDHVVDAKPSEKPTVVNDLDDLAKELHSKQKAKQSSEFKEAVEGQDLAKAKAAKAIEQKPKDEFTEQVKRELIEPELVPVEEPARESKLDEEVVDSPDPVFQSYADKVVTCESEEECRLMLRAVKASGSLSDAEKKKLHSMLDDRVFELRAH
ncbi:MAG: phage recombination protein Bet [bacterium]|nr:phage recombination protein Bet [bacterium]